MERKEPTPSEDPIHGASSSSTSPHGGDYGGRKQRPKGNGHGVFLSFKGKTISESFSQNLYNSLVHAGIDTSYSVHQPRRKMGSGKLNSLRQSKISIPIFSPFYAFSISSLRELVHMLECKRSSGQIVLPIFYGVRPSVVQHVEGRFRQAFSRYEGRVDKTELGEWRTALVEVGSLRVWATENFAYGNDGALIKLIVTRVVNLLKRPFKLPKELVGIDDHEKYIMSSLDPKYNDTRIIGICGVRGSGKTTLAKILWNNLSGDFEHLSFVPNIQEVSLRMGIEFLQEELICDIQRSPHIVSDVGEGIGIIKSQFTSKKVLVILDDMDEDIHLNALVGDGNWLKAGSVVIMTTRNMNFLDRANADPKYKLNLWTLDQALTLFSRHLFGKDSPPAAYEHISRDVVSSIARIPLMLELTGSFFRQRKEEVWEDTFMKLKDDLNNKNDPRVLQITYESLDYEQQQIFLDIACLSIESSKQHPTYMWDSCGFLPKEGIGVLKAMSLIEIDKDDKLIMRKHLKDFGMEIVHLEDQKGLQQCSRLWDYGKALDVLDNNKGTNMIQAICLNECNSERSYTGEKFKGLTNLRFLKVCGANFTGDFENRLSELRWLHWEHCPSNFEAANFHLKQLVVLNLSESKISKNWGGWGPIKMATNLKVLNLSKCPFFRRTPDLSAFESLEILILEKCENLEKIDPSIGDIKSLISLNVSGCRRVEKLPNEIGRLKELKELLINKTAKREIPMSGDGLMKLETLNASCCGRLEELPTGVGEMDELRKLIINDTAIRKIPISRGGLKKLETMCASYCEELAQLSESMDFLVSLTELNLSHSGIEELPESMVFPKSLSRLNLSYSWIEKLPKSLNSLFLLTELDLSQSGIREFPKFRKVMQQLTRLDLSHTGIEELPKSMNSLKALTYLNLSYLWIKKLPESMGDLVSLQHLLLQGCYLLRHLPDSMGSLTELDIRYTGITELPHDVESNMKNSRISDIRETCITRLPDQFNFSLHDHEISWEQM